MRGINATADITYILKRYPRFSETFILNELLGLEQHRTRVSIVSLLPVEADQVRHPAVADVRARVRYLSDVTVFQRAGIHLRAAIANPGGYVRHAIPAAAGALRGRRASWKTFRRATIAADAIRQDGGRHIHAHFATAATEVAAVAAAMTGRTFSFTAHAKDIYEIDADGMERLRRMLETAAFVVTVSEFNRRYLSGIAPNAEIHVVDNGLDPVWMHARTQHPPIKGNPADPPLVLAVGRLVEKKGFADLISACDVLRNRGISFRCRIVGAGPLQSELRRLIVRSGLAEHVELAGPSDQVTLRSLHFAAAACLVAPCVVAGSGDRDGLPTVLVEAMASGVPVISTDVTAIPELITDGQTGRLVSQRSPVELADAIAACLADPIGSRAMAMQAQQFTRERFDRRTTTANLKRLFDSADPRREITTPLALRREVTT